MPQSQEENDWLAKFGDTHLENSINTIDRMSILHFSTGSDLVYTNWRAGQPSGDGPGVHLIAGSK